MSGARMARFCWSAFSIVAPGFADHREEVFLAPGTTVSDSGFSTDRNRLELWVEGVRVGEVLVEPDSAFQAIFLIPMSRTENQVLETRIVCSEVHESPTAGDERVLGVMVFSVELLESFSAPGS